MFLKQTLIATASIIVGSLAASTPAAIGDFNLRAEAFANNVNDGSTFYSNPQSYTFNGAPGSGSVTSTTPYLAGVTATQKVSASLTDAYHGSISFSDSWESTNLPLGQMRFGAASDYTFVTASAATLQVSWAAQFAHSGIGPASFGMYDISMYVDGTQYLSPSSAAGWVTPDTAGSWTVNLGAGTHNVSFVDYGNIYGGVGTRFDSISETLNFGVNAAPVPEPATLAVLGLGAAGFIRRRRSSRN